MNGDAVMHLKILIFLFWARSNHADDELLRAIVEIAPLSLEELNAIGDEERRDFLKVFMGRPRRSLADVIPNCSNHALDLLEKIFIFNPNDRITASQALKHPFFEDLHDSDDEPDGKLFDNSFEHISGPSSFKAIKMHLQEEIKTINTRSQHPSPSLPAPNSPKMEHTSSTSSSRAPDSP